MLSISLGNCQTTESFDVLLKTLAHTYSEEERNEVRSHWEGIKTWEGFNMVVGEILKNIGGNRRLYSFSILERMELPPDEMVDRLFTGAKAALNEPSSLPPHLVMLEKFPQDDRIIEWLAGLLNDQRLVPDPKKKPGEDRSGGQTARVCDCASGTITRMLTARKQIPYEGLQVGDPSLEYEYPGRDRYNLELARKLNGLGFKVKLPTLTSERPPSQRPEKPRVDLKEEPATNPGRKSIAIAPKITKNDKNQHWMIWSIASVSGLLLVFFGLRKIPGFGPRN